MGKDYIYRRSRIRTLNRGLYARIVKIYDYRCAICGWGLPSVAPNNHLLRQGGCELHHITPYAQGGEATEDNLILLCPNCHKQADYGFITIERLKKAQRKEIPRKVEHLKKQHAKLRRRKKKDSEKLLSLDILSKSHPDGKKERAREEHAPSHPLRDGTMRRAKDLTLLSSPSFLNGFEIDPKVKHKVL